jgi:hypothetical protein
VLYTRPADFRYAEEVEFVSHAVRGMSSTMCFRRNFARELLADLEADRTHGVTQDVIAKVTMPKFQCKVSGRRTAIYHAHEGALTSSGWLPDIFGDATNKA